MKKKLVDYKNCINKKFFSSKLNKDYSKILKNIILNLDKSNNIFHSLSNKFKYNFKAKEINKFKKYKTIAIIGMGGSILGVEALYFFLKEKIKKNFLFFNNIDQNQLKNLEKNNKLDKILFIVISKSGNTIETLVNLLALKIIKKNSKNIIVISKKNNSPLYLLSKKMKFYHIEHKNYIGGRYSVLSETGVVPGYLMGINIQQLRKSLLNHFKIYNKKFLKNSSVMLANLYNKKQFNNLIFFNYVPQLEKFLYWNQQLIAESLGKKGKGFLPLISSAPKDHHSLLQLYLDGPRDKLFYIFSVEKKENEKINTKDFDKRLNFLNGKSLSRIKEAQKEAFIKVLKKKQIPFREFKIQKINEQTIGELFSYFMIETAIVGRLAKINPFDQPAVEQVKIETKRILD